MVQFGAGRAVRAALPAAERRAPLCGAPGAEGGFPPVLAARGRAWRLPALRGERSPGSLRCLAASFSPSAAERTLTSLGTSERRHFTDRELCPAPAACTRLLVELCQAAM